MKNQKQGGGWTLLIFGIILLAIGLLCLASESEMIFGTEVSNINKLLSEHSLESNLDSYIELDIDAVLDNFAEMTHKTYGITTGKDQYYIIWLDDDSMIALSANGKNAKELDRIMDETWDYVDEKTEDLTADRLHIKGKLVNLTLDEKKYYQESLDDLGLTPDSRDLHYYKIDCTDSQLFLILMVVVLCGLGLLLIVLFVNHRRAMRRAMEAADYTFAGPVSEADKLSGFYDNTNK